MIHFFKKIYNLSRLMRWNQPTGFFLLLWPALWGLWITNKGFPSNNITIILIFIVGTICMRSAGCIINDYIDKNIDNHVERTKNRPLIDGTISEKEALITCLILIVISIGLVCVCNIKTILIALNALILSIIYPFLKRFFYFPQLVLGIIFSCPILMTCTVINHPIIDEIITLLFIANTIWVIVYDTEYAMIDRNDDIKICIKSSAILFGNWDKLIIGVLQFIIIFIFFLIAWKENLSIFFYIFSILGVTILFIWQHILIHNRSRIGCLKAFWTNNYVGLLIFIGFFLNFS